MKMNLKIFITCLFTFFCFYMCTTYPPVSEPPKIWYSASYDYDLMKVEKSGDIIEIDSTYSSICIFEDSLINIKWSIKHNKLLFNLVNKTQNTLSINWDNIIFVDTDGGAITVNLPAGIEGTHYKIINCGSSGNNVTLDPNGVEQVWAGGAGVAFTMVDGDILNLHYNSVEGWW